MARLERKADPSNEVDQVSNASNHPALVATRGQSDGLIQIIDQQSELLMRWLMINDTDTNGTNDYERLLNLTTDTLTALQQWGVKDRSLFDYGKYGKKTKTNDDRR